MSDTFDYAQVPHGFIHCLQAECPKAATCLRQMAYAHLPEQEKFLHVINPKQQLPRKGTCRTTSTHNRCATHVVSCVLSTHCPWGNSKHSASASSPVSARRSTTLRAKANGRSRPKSKKRSSPSPRQLGLQLDDYFDKYEYRLRW